MIGHGLRIHLTKTADGWLVQFGAMLSSKRPLTLIAAKAEGIVLARQVLTECLMTLADTTNSFELNNDQI